jgi:hypothetical protein
MQIRIQNQDCTQPSRQGVLQLLFFVLHDESGQTVLAALYEKDAKKFGEENAIVKQDRCRGEKKGNIIRFH